MLSRKLGLGSMSFGQFNLQAACFRVQCPKNRCISQWVDDAVHTGNGIQTAHGYCIELPVAVKELQRAALCWGKDNKRCPISFSRFDDFKHENLCDLILFELARFGSISLLHGVNLQCNQCSRHDIQLSLRCLVHLTTESQVRGVN